MVLFLVTISIFTTLARGF